jgi:eukaryotic-like serine/threonine-protein kinase
VATSTLKKRSNFWRTDWFVGVLVVLAVFMVNRTTNFVDALDNRLYDFGLTQANKKPSDQIAIIAIDDQSIQNIGRWPWSRDVQAKLIEQISSGKPKAIVNSIFYPEPQEERATPYFQRIEKALEGLTKGTDPNIDEISRVVSEAKVQLNADVQLAAALAKAGNVIGAVNMLPGDARARPDKPLSAVTTKSLIKAPPGFGVEAGGITESIDVLAVNMHAVGAVNKRFDFDGSIRQEPLLTDFFGQSVPSIALQAAVKGLNLTNADVRVLPEEPAIQLGKLKIGTDETGQMRPFYYADRDGKPAFTYDSAFDVASGKVPPSKYAGKVVLLGQTAAGVSLEFPTPLGRGMTPIEQSAHVTSSLLSEHFVIEPWWTRLVGILAFLAVAIYLLVMLPRLSAGSGAITTAAVFVLILAASYFTLTTASLWLPLMLPAVLLLMGHLALTTKRFLVTEEGKAKSDEESAETNRMMGLALAGQGRLDEAFDRYRRVPASNALLDNMGNLALDFERKRQFNKAQAVYEHMATLDKNHKGLSDKLNRAKNLSETVILGGGGAHPGGTMLLDGGGVEKPMLGRYSVEKELGKGAMGVVYLGKDPKIGRVVAIKTMALSQEFDGDELTDARERFFREAETAGRLQHPHIVTIYDAGEEHDLAYIAMEFLKGKDLVDYCKDGHLLPMQRVVSIVERVAVALAYAHKHSVVHRDIKPANVMYEHSSDTVKVTDFGIARITDSSKTKTGLVLGTPSFMSPEQIAGKKVDGRSDLYSLGVMLFQMLAGVLPFRGDSMAELMYKIANEEAPDIRIIRAEIPLKLAHVVAMSLSKRPETRYQDGEQFAADLRAVMGDLTGEAASATKQLTAAFGADSAADEKTRVMAAISAADMVTQVMKPESGSEKTQVFAREYQATEPAPLEGVGGIEQHAATQKLTSYASQQAELPKHAEGSFEKTKVTRPHGQSEQ